MSFKFQTSKPIKFAGQVKIQVLKPTKDILSAKI
jgi:hypothetical protein